MNPPAFVIAGQPNAGKTSVFATLTENGKANIGPIPGTTRKNNKYTVKADGDVKLVIYDTPGFMNPGDLLEWFKKNAALHVNPTKVFLSIPAHIREYPFDCEILSPISEGAAVIYVVDPGLELRDVDKFEAEIFRLCKVPRIGLMNSRIGEVDNSKDWIDLLTVEMNTWREFNACEAVQADRLELLKALTIAAPKWEEKMKEVVESLDIQWKNRLTNIADMIIETLKDAVKIEVFEPYDGVKNQNTAKIKADDKVREEIGDLEKVFREKVRKKFCHKDDQWLAGHALEMDLFHKDVWQIFGFSKVSLVVGAATAGAGAGFLIDLASGGGTLGIASMAGSIITGVFAYFSADKAVEMTLPEIRWGFFKIPGTGKKIGGVSIKARISSKSQLPSILLDRMSCYAVAAARWSHGRRPATPEASPTDDAWKITKALNQGGDTKAVSRLQSLIELWHRSSDGKLGAKNDQVVIDSEKWLKEQLVQLLRRATCEKIGNTNPI
jgi:Domain of unknown function (DUF3482)/50S ribosome-binding GTPase